MQTSFTTPNIDSRYLPGRTLSYSTPCSSVISDDSITDADLIGPSFSRAEQSSNESENDDDDDEDFEEVLTESLPRQQRAKRYHWVSEQKFFQLPTDLKTMPDHVYEQTWHSKRKLIEIENKFYYRSYVFNCSSHEHCPYKVFKPN